MWVPLVYWNRIIKVFVSWFMKSIWFCFYQSAEIEISTILLTGLFYMWQNYVESAASYNKHDT